MKSSITKQDLLDALDELLSYKEGDAENSERIAFELDDPDLDVDGAHGDLQRWRTFRERFADPSVAIVEGSLYDRPEIQKLYLAAREARGLIMLLGDVAFGEDDDLEAKIVATLTELDDVLQMVYAAVQDEEHPNRMPN